MLFISCVHDFWFSQGCSVEQWPTLNFQNFKTKKTMAWRGDEAMEGRRVLVIRSLRSSNTWARWIRWQGMGVVKARSWVRFSPGPFGFFSFTNFPYFFYFFNIFHTILIYFIIFIHALKIIKNIFPFAFIFRKSLFNL